MIEFIQDYGITTIQYEYIINHLRINLIEAIELSEHDVREVLEYYNSLGIKENLYKLILERPDLIITSRSSIESSVEKITKNLFVSLVNKSVEDLILFGI